MFNIAQTHLEFKLMKEKEDIKGIGNFLDASEVCNNFFTQILNQIETISKI